MGKKSTFLLFAAWVFLITLRAPFIEYGDGREYVIQTQALLFDRSISINRELRAPYFNETNPFGIILRKDIDVEADKNSPNVPIQSGGGFGGLFRDRFGDLRFCHFWLYSLFAVPVYGMVHLLAGAGGSEYAAFRILNVLLFLLPLGIVWRREASYRNLAMFLLLLVTPLTGYLQWIHAEIFCFSLTATSFLLISSRRWKWLSPCILAVAAIQNIPIALFFPLHFILFIRGQKIFALSLRTIVVYLIAAAIVFGNLLYWRYYFETWSVYQILGMASLSFISVRKLLSVLLSPLAGVIFYYPMIFLLPSRIHRKNVLIVISLIVSILCVAAFACATDNLFSAQIGAIRYSAWFLAPLVWFLLSEKPVALIHRCLELAGMGAVGIILLAFQTIHFAGGDFARALPYFADRSEVRALYRWTGFEDDPEVLAENISESPLNKPFNFDRIYIWELGESKSLWLLSKRAVQKMTHLNFDSDSGVSVESSPLQNVVSCQEKRCSFARDAVTRYFRHPVYGSYAYLWITGDVRNIVTDARYSLASPSK